MKVLYVVSAMLPWEVHGLSVHLKYLTINMKNIAEITVLYTVASNCVGDTLKIEYINGIKTVMIPANNNVVFPENTPCAWIQASFPLTQCWNQVVKFLKQENFDIVHFQDYYSALGAELVKKNSSAKVVSTIHALAERKGHISTGIQNWLISNSDAVITVSQWEENLVREHFDVNNVCLKTIYNGTNMTYTGDYERNLITFAGRLERKKGCDIFLEAIAQIGTKSIRKFGKSIVIAGGGSEEAKLHLLAEKLGIDDICHFVGEISHEEVENVLAHSSIHVVPSRHEPFGLSAIEAMAKGAFTIVSNVGGLPETLISQDIGKCIESENVDALASNIMDILENPIREDKRKILGESVSARFSWKVVAEETYRLYQSLLTEKRTN